MNDQKRTVVPVGLLKNLTKGDVGQTVQDIRKGKSMRITIVGPYPPPYGGISTSVQQLRHHLLRDHYDVSVLVPSREQACEAERVYCHSGFRSLHISRNYLYLIKHLQPDLINSHSNRWPMMSAVASRLLGIPLIHTIHGENAPNAFEKLPFLQKELVKWAFQHTDRVIAVSEDLARFVMSLGVLKEKIATVPSLLPLEVNLKVKPTLKDGLQQITNGRRVVLVSTGFYSKIYGFDLIPPVAFMLKQKSVDFVWLIVGHGMEQEKQPVRSALSRLGLQDHVLLIGEVDRFQMIDVLRCSHIYVRTKYSDSFGLVIAEAHQLGCHCLFGDNNPYFQESKRLTKYRVGDVDSLTGKLFKTIGKIDVAAPRDTESQFAEEAFTNYRKVKDLYRQITSTHKR